jgi:hypothetical protein
MPATVGPYDFGDLAQLIATYTSTDLVTPADPSSVYYFVKSPASSLATYLFTAGAGGSITRVATGIYRKDVTTDVYGIWEYASLGTGGVQAAEKWHFIVDRFIF